MDNIIQQQVKNKNNVSTQKENNANSIKDWIKVYEHQIKKALPNALSAERFTRMVLTAITQNPNLAKCTPQSFIGAMLTSAQLGLEPNTPLGQAYLIPFKDKEFYTCQFQIGYKGYIDLVYRSGELQTLESHIVYENDFFEFELGLNPTLKHKPAISNKGSAIWVYAIYRLVNGGYAFEIMSIEDIKSHAKKYSKSFNNASSPWNKDFESMAKKTVIKRLLKYAPLKAEIGTQLTNDESTHIVTFTDDNEFIIEQNNDNEILQEYIKE